MIATASEALSGDEGPKIGPVSVPVSEQGDRSVEESANRKLAEAQEGQIAGQQKKQQETDQRGLPDEPSRASAQASTPTNTSASASSGTSRSSEEAEASTSTSASGGASAKSESSSIAKSSAGSGTLASSGSGAHVWIGSSSGDGEALSSSSASELDEEKLASHDGIGIIYFPLVPNLAVPNFDPLSISTWRFELQRAESDQLMGVARANVDAGDEMIVKVLRAMWLRKRRAREELEKRRK